MSPSPTTTFRDGLTMPPRYAPHERTYISWPLEVDYRWSLKEARNEHAFLAKAHPEREIVPVPPTAMAADGGGVGCVTQQQPAGRLLQ